MIRRGNGQREREKDNLQALGDFDGLGEVALVGDLDDVAPHSLVILGVDGSYVLGGRGARRHRAVADLHSTDTNQMRDNGIGDRSSFITMGSCLLLLCLLLFILFHVGSI